MTRALIEQRQAIGRFKIFLGMTYSDTVMPSCVDCIEFSSYCGTGRNRQLAKAGNLDILPVHYSQLPEEAFRPSRSLGRPVSLPRCLFKMIK